MSDRPYVQPILVWQFYDAPEKYQALSGHGGDEDWIAVLPPGADWPMWAESGTRFGVCEVSKHELPDGCVVLIGAHA